MDDEENKFGQRYKWTCKSEYMKVAIVFMIGISNLSSCTSSCFRFGGVVYVIVYLFCLGILGIPLLYLGLLMGQFSGRTGIYVYNFCPLLRGVAVCSCLISGTNAFYYNVLSVWSMYYMAGSIDVQLAWSTCSNSWNTPLCELIYDKSNGTSDKPTGSVGLGNTSMYEYFMYNMLSASDGPHHMGTPTLWLTLCLLLLWILAFLSTWRGMQTFTKVANIVSTFPFLCLTVLFVIGMSNIDSISGLKMALRPDFSKLADFELWIDAGRQAFFTINISSGMNTLLGSFSQFYNNDVNTIAIVAPLIDLSYKLMASLAIFAAIGNNPGDGRRLQESLKSGSLDNVGYLIGPAILSDQKMPQLWSFIYFLMLFLTAYSTLIGLVECCVYAALDAGTDIINTRYKEIIVRSLFYGGYFLFSLVMVTPGGLYVYTFLSTYTGGVTMFIIALLNVIGTQVIYGPKKYLKDMTIMLGKPPHIYWRICWYISPVFLLILIFCSVRELVHHHPAVALNGYEFPDSSLFYIFFVDYGFLLAIPGWMLYELCRQIKIQGLYPIKPTHLYRYSGISKMMRYLTPRLLSANIRTTCYPIVLPKPDWERKEQIPEVILQEKLIVTMPNARGSILEDGFYFGTAHEDDDDGRYSAYSATSASDTHTTDNMSEASYATRAS